MYCSNCGKEIEEGTLRCGYCGTWVENKTDANKTPTRTVGLMGIVQWVSGLSLMFYGLIIGDIGHHIIGVIVMCGGGYMLPPFEKITIRKFNFRMSNPLKIVVIIMLFILPLMLLAGGEGIESDQGYVHDPEPDLVEESPLDNLVITYQEGYFTETSTQILFTMKNTGSKDVEFIRVQISMYDVDGNLIKTKDLYPSPYDSWGLRAGDSFDFDQEFHDVVAARYKIKITNARFV